MLLIICLCLFEEAWSTSTFNYEVGARVHDRVGEYLELVSRASSLPLKILDTPIGNLSNLFKTSQFIFFPSIIQYTPEITTMYLGLENGEAALYGDVPVYLTYCHGVGSINMCSNYLVNQKTGITNSIFANYTFDPRIRPWYKAAKAAQAPIWSAPYLNYQSLHPVITITFPIFNKTLHGIFYSWVGTVAADISLEAINQFLSGAYGNTDHKVFIIDTLTGNLLGNSWNAPIADDKHMVIII